jgi:predicted ArsR family transcriptional regulator
LVSSAATVCLTQDKTINYAQNRAGNVILAALDLLKKLGGAVALHDTDGKTFIRGKSCPLAAITAHYPDACLVVEALLTEIIGVPVKEHCTHGQSPSCCFEVS